MVEGREEVEGGIPGAVKREETSPWEDRREGATTGEVVSGETARVGVTGSVTGRVGAEGTGGAGGAGQIKDAGAALLDSWYLAARRRFFALCAGPRWRGWVGRGGGGW